ncbi:MAG: hypothetical protein MUF49_26355 [Oculatellaceae cyanobacterium Prado106]|jgi:hypothetical protein|nr:hypothetical protein [Oculatellaceae cyanobacterium Prado106]
MKLESSAPATHTKLELFHGLEIQAYRLSSEVVRIGIAEASISLGYDRNWLGRVLKRQGLTLNKLKAIGFSGEVQRIEFHTFKGIRKAKTISLEDFHILVSHEIQGRGTRVPKLRKPRGDRQQIEREITEAIADQESGVMNVVTPAGLIDILTDTHLIEVKEYKNWKSAIGQTIAYGFYFPKHKKQIHLFGDIGTINLDVVRTVCASIDIEITQDDRLWEVKQIDSG